MGLVGFQVEHVLHMFPRATSIEHMSFIGVVG